MASPGQRLKLTTHTTTNTGELHARYSRRMKSWPHLGQRGEVVLKAVAQVARWTLPSFLCHENLGELAQRKLGCSHNANSNFNGIVLPGLMGGSS